MSSRKKSGKIFFSSEGFTLLDLMIAIGLVAITTMTTMSLVTQSTRLSADDNLQSSILLVRSRIFKHLSRYDNFQATVFSTLNATTVGCASTGSPLHYTCSSVSSPTPTTDTNITTFSPLVLLYGASVNYPPTGPGPTPVGANQIFYDSSDLKNGFTMDGRNCAAKGAAGEELIAPSPTCPIRVDFKWYNMSTVPIPNNPGISAIKVFFSTYRPRGKSNVQSRIVLRQGFTFVLLKSVYANGTTGNPSTWTVPPP